MNATVWGAIRVRKELFDRVTAHCEATGLRKTWVVTRAIEIWLAQQEQPSEAPKKEAAPAQEAA